MANASSLEDNSFRESLRKCHNDLQPRSKDFKVVLTEQAYQHWCSQRNDSQLKKIIYCNVNAEIIKNVIAVQQHASIEEQGEWTTPAPTSLPPGTELDTNTDFPPEFIDYDLEDSHILNERKGQEPITHFCRRKPLFNTNQPVEDFNIHHRRVEVLGHTADIIQDVDSAYSSNRSHGELVATMMVLFGEQEYKWFYKLKRGCQLQMVLDRLYLKAQSKLHSITGQNGSFSLNDITSNDKKLLLYDFMRSETVHYDIEMKISVKL